MKLVTFMISQCVLLCTVSFHRCILKPKTLSYNVRHFTSIIHADSLNTVQSINTRTFYVRRFLFLNRASIHNISLLFLALPLQEQLIHFSSLEFFFYLKRGKSYFFNCFIRRELTVCQRVKHLQNRQVRRFEICLDCVAFQLPFFSFFILLFSQTVFRP